MSNIGLDYSLGLSNFDPKTGIHFGVISSHTVGERWYEQAESDYGKPHCPKCGEEVKPSDDEVLADEDWNNGMDYACENCKQCFWSDRCFPDEASGQSFEDEDYTLSDCLDSDIFVLRSPYYTFAQYCSPCVPGAGNLDHPVEGGAKTYALGHDWFEDDKAPYPVYRVADDTEVTA